MATKAQTPESHEMLSAEERLARKEEVERDFKPLFDQYGEEGMPLRDIRRVFHEAGVDSEEKMPPGKMEVLIRRADKNLDRHISYFEFLRLMMANPRLKWQLREDLSWFQKLVRASVSSVVPKNATARIPLAGEPKDETDLELGWQEEPLVLDDYIANYNCKPPPLFMILVSVIEMIIFIVYAVELGKTKDPVTATSGVAYYSPLIYKPSRRYEVWRYLTYMFIHVGYLHLIFNLIFQLMLGIPLEMVHKWWRVGIVYMLGVIAGSLGHSVFDPATMLAGASGGCYALIGAHFAIVVMNWKEMMYEWMSGSFIRLILSAPIRLLLMSVLGGTDTIIAIVNRYTNGGGNNVGFAAHFGGFLSGLLIGIPVLKNIDEKPWERVLWWVCLIVYLVGVLFAVCWNGFYPGFPDTDWSACC